MGAYNPYASYKKTTCDWLDEVPDHWSFKRIKNIATYNDEVLSDKTDADYELEYVDISSVSLVNGIEKTETMKFEKAPSRARRKVKQGDVIVSTVRTYLKAIAPVINPPENMIVSTGFAVVRPMENLHSGYAGYLLQSNGFVGDVVARSVGVSYPAINASDLARIPAVEPPPEEQQTIAAFLDYKTAKIDALIAKKKALLEKLAEKRISLISHAVTKGLDPGAPMRDSGIDWLGEIPAHWEFTMLRRMIAKPFANGIFKKREHWGKGNKIVNVFDVYVKGDVIDESTLERVLCNDDEAEKYSANHGDFFFVRSSLKLEGIGKSAVVLQPTEPMVFECHLVRGRPDTNKIDPEFLCYTLNSLYCKQMLISYANQVTMATLDQEKFKSLRLPLPPIEEQRKVVDYLHCQTKKFENHEKVITDVIARLQEYRSALITNAVTGKIDLRNFRLPEAEEFVNHG